MEEAEVIWQLVFLAEAGKQWSIGSFHTICKPRMFFHIFLELGNKYEEEKEDTIQTAFCLQNVICLLFRSLQKKLC